MKLLLKKYAGSFQITAVINLSGIWRIQKPFTRYSTLRSRLIDIVEAFNPNKLTENLKKDCLIQIDNCINLINEKANQLGYKYGKHWFLNKKEKNDIANIALQYRPVHIINALHTVYDSFILQGRPADNVGA